MFTNRIFWSVGAKVRGKPPVLERPTNMDNGRLGEYCACSWCEWGCLDIFSRLSFVIFFSLSGRRPDIDGNTFLKCR